MADKDLQAKAQYLLHLLAGPDLPPTEYTEKLSLVHDQLLVVYSLGYRDAEEEDVFKKKTVIPPVLP